MPSADTPSGEDRNSPHLVLGIDGGGTGTTALLAPSAGSRQGLAGQILGRGTGGPSNHQAVGQARALAGLDEAIDRAFRDAGLSRGPVAAACLGLAGADRPPDRAMLTAWATESRLAGRVRFENDAGLVLAAGTPEGWGLAVIAGTGSIAAARSPEGSRSRAGGWGYLIGDEGSGYAIAVAGLRAVARAADGRGPATALTRLFCDRLGITGVEGLVTAVYAPGQDRAILAGRATAVTEAAAAGDAVARGILASAAEELGDSAAAAAATLAIAPGPIPLAMAGGLLVCCEPLRTALVESLARRGLRIDPIGLVAEPALGALLLAREALGRSH